MKRILFILVPIFALNVSYSMNQRFVVIDGDTTIAKKEIYKIVDHDTFYVTPCHSFEIKEDKIINYKDSNCLKQGAWITYDKNKALYQKGNFNNNLKEGTWLFFADEGLKDTIYWIIYKNGDAITRLNYTDDQIESIQLRKASQRFFENFWGLILFILLVIFYLRIPINNEIYNVLDKSEKNIFFISPGKGNLLRLSKSFFTFYWSKSVLKENPELNSKRKEVNVLSVIFILLFLGMIIFSFATNSGID